jgi:hypothetical protein
LIAFDKVRRSFAQQLSPFAFNLDVIFLPTRSAEVDIKLSKMIRIW